MKKSKHISILKFARIAITEAIFLYLSTTTVSSWLDIIVLLFPITMTPVNIIVHGVSYYHLCKQEKVTAVM
ncbi:KRAB domain-containing zinc finger protein [Sarotherodon galilaeus]